jgi:hypothetical protein
MKRHLGRISLLLAVACWLVYVVSLAVGGLDPAPELASHLQNAILISLLLGLISGCLAMIALTIGPQRLSAAIALALALLYTSVFTGAGFLVISWFLR